MTSYKTLAYKTVQCVNATSCGYISERSV